MLSKCCPLIIALLLLFTQPACTQQRAQLKAKGTSITGQAIKIIDGDTFDLLTEDHTTYRIRLHGIDCPERGMDYYKVCKTALGNFCEGHQITITIRDIDRYKRTVADVYTAEGQWINQQMVAGGYAWHYVRYDQDPRLESAMQEARSKGLGLWSMPSPTPPWEWRKEKRQKNQRP